MTRLLLVLPIVLLCSLPTLTMACNRQCQREVLHVFADKYQPVSSHYFDHLRTQIGSILFQDLPLGTTTITKAQSQKAIQIMQESVTRAQNTWDVDLTRKAFEAIFVDEPNFVGDCVENIPPERVLQKFTTPNHKGAGDSGGGGPLWTIQDCHEANYICGQPPSICHFLPLIKKRISTKVKAGLRSKLDTGDDTDLYVNYLGPALQRILDEYEGLTPFKAVLHGTLNLIMVGCLEEIDRLGVGEADIDWVEGSTLWKKEWDQEIREKVLTYT